MARCEDLEKCLEHLCKRLGPLHVLDGVHAILVVVALGLHGCDLLAAGMALLGVEHGHGVVQGGLDDADDVHGMGGRFGVQGGDGLGGEPRQRLIEGEVVLQGLVHGVLAPTRGRLGQPVHHLGAQQTRPDLDTSPVQPTPPRRVGDRSVDDVLDGRDGVLVTLQHVEHHRVGDAHGGVQRLRGGVDEFVEGLLGVVDVSFRGLLALHLAFLLRVVTGLGQGLRIGDDVLGGLGDDVSDGVEAGSSGASGDLVELARLEHPVLVAVEFRQRGEHDGANGHIDAHPQGVRAADHLEQATLGQRFHEATVLGQHSGVVHADTSGEVLADRRAEAS